MQTVIRNLHFQNLKPSKFVAGLKKPEGIVSLTPNDAQMRLTVQGEKEAVELLAQLVPLADVRSLRYQLALTLVRLGPGTRRTVIEKKILVLENNTKVAQSLGQGALELQGVLHGSPKEAQLTFAARVMRGTGAQRVAAESLQVMRRLPFQKTVAIARFDDPNAKRPTNKKIAPIALVLEALATEITRSPVK